MAVLSVFHGLFYVATGLWPVFSLPTFEAVTGPKADRWLVRTVGLLIAVIGLALLIAGLRGRVTVETATLGIGASVSLAAISLWYVPRRVIPPIYLLDAALEIALAAAWVLLWTRPA